MARPARTALVAVLVGLVLGACSGSGEGGTAAQPLPPETSTSPATPTSSAGETSAAPEPGLPAGVRADIALPSGGDAARSALLRDWKAGQVAYLAAAAVPDPRSKAVARYYAREALATTTGTLQDRVKNRRAVVGTRRIGTVAVQSQTSTAAAMSWCVDDSKFFTKDLRTGKPIINHDNDFYRVRGQLLLDPRLKVWVLVRAVLAEEDVRC